MAYLQRSFLHHFAICCAITIASLQCLNLSAKHELFSPLWLDPCGPVAVVQADNNASCCKRDLQYGRDYVREYVYRCSSVCNMYNMRVLLLQYIGMV